VTRGTAYQLFFMGFLLVVVVFVLYWIYEQVRRLSSKRGRKEIGKEIRGVGQWVVEDRAYLAKEFRVTLVIFGLMAFAFLIALLD
jgi:hypothetical protein